MAVFQTKWENFHTRHVCSNFLKSGAELMWKAKIDYFGKNSKTFFKQLQFCSMSKMTQKLKFGIIS